MSGMLRPIWKVLPVDELVRFDPEADEVSQLDPDQRVQIVRAGALRHGRLIVRDEPVPLGRRRKRLQRFRNDDLLVPRSINMVQKLQFAVAQNLPPIPHLTYRDALVLRPTSGVRAQWLWHFLHLPDVQEQILRRAEPGSDHLRTSMTGLGPLLVPLPPLAEQDRLMALIGEVKELQSLRTATDRAMTDMLTPVFEALCSATTQQLLTGPTILLGRVAEVTTGSPAMFGVPSGACRITAAELVDRDIARPADAGSAPIRPADRVFPGGSIMMDSEVTWGRLLQPALTDQPFLSVKSNDPSVPTGFLWGWLRVASQYIRSLIGETEELIPEMLAAVPVPDVPEEVRFRIASAVDELENLLTLGDEQARLMKQLGESLRVMAFSGNLAVLPRSLDLTPTRPLAVDLPVRSVLARMSLEQQRIWNVSCSLNGPFDAEELADRLGRPYRGYAARKRLLETLDLLVLLGVLVRMARDGVEAWRPTDQSKHREGSE